VGTSRRRGPPAKGPDASPDSTNANDIDSFAPQAEEAREALRRLLKVQCAGCYRPYMILGIDLSQYIDGSEVTGFGKCAATASHRRRAFQPPPAWWPAAAPTRPHCLCRSASAAAACRRDRRHAPSGLHGLRLGSARPESRPQLRRVRCVGSRWCAPATTAAPQCVLPLPVVSFRLNLLVVCLRSFSYGLWGDEPDERAFGGGRRCGCRYGVGRTVKQCHCAPSTERAPPREPSF
jgi:hypothetical protein